MHLSVNYPFALVTVAAADWPIDAQTWSVVTAASNSSSIAGRLNKKVLGLLVTLRFEHVHVVFKKFSRQKP